MLCEIGFVQQGHLLHICCFLPQVHFVPDAGTVAQIVYTDDQVRPPQQVVYTADGASYASVDDPEHTLVYIHPVEAAQACEGLLFVNRLTYQWLSVYSLPVTVLGAGEVQYTSDKICALQELITILAEEDVLCLFKLNVLRS